MTWIFFFHFFYLCFSISSFCNKLLVLELCYFFTFFLYGYSESGLVKLIRVGLGFSWFFFFIELWFFLQGHRFDFFFYLDHISRVVGSLSYPELTWVFFSVLYILMFFLIFDIRLLDLKFYNSFLLFFFNFFFIIYAQVI